MKRFLTRSEWEEWSAAGRPPMSDRQFRLAMRSITLAASGSLEKGDQYARKVLARLDREAGVIALARAAGEDPERAMLMAGEDVDPELRRMYFNQLAEASASGRSAPMTLASGESAPMTLAGGIDPDEARIMMDADPALRSIWLGQLARQPEPSTVPLGMDDERYRLHKASKQLADARCLANPMLDPGETYCLAAVELEERMNPTGVI